LCPDKLAGAGEGQHKQPHGANCLGVQAGFIFAQCLQKNGEVFDIQRGKVTFLEGLQCPFFWGFCG